MCHCGSNIAGTVDVKAVAEYAKTLDSVVVARDYQFMCSEPGQALIKSDIKELGLNLTSGTKIDVEITGGYASDLLSCVMAGAKAGNIWVTLQAHPNIIAVASLLELSAVVVTEGVAPDPETLSRAEEMGIPLLTAAQDTFSVVAGLAALGIKGSRD